VVDIDGEATANSLLAEQDFYDAFDPSDERIGMTTSFCPTNGPFLEHHTVLSPVGWPREKASQSIGHRPVLYEERLHKVEQHGGVRRSLQVVTALSRW
jgi:hypothetical protein